MDNRSARSFRLGLIQMDSGIDIHENLRTVLALAEEAVAEGAKCIALPEVFDVIDDDREPAQALSENTALRALAKMARDHKVWIHAGSVKEAHEGGKPFNASVLLNDRGEIEAVYRKLHLFDVVLPSGVPILESNSMRAGDHVVVADTPFGRFGMSICYDVRFPELYRTLRKRGAEILFVPSNFTEETGRDHWEVLLRSRAIENGCYVVAAAQAGTKYHGRASYGHSMVVDPWGNVLARIPDEPGVRVVDIDRAVLESVRSRLPFANRRGDIWPLEISAVTNPIEPK